MCDCIAGFFLLSGKMVLQMLGSSTTPLQDDHDEKFGVPSLEELGFDCESLKPPVWHGGEMEALSRLERHLERKAWVASFGLPKMTPQVTKNNTNNNKLANHSRCDSYFNLKLTH